MLSDKVMLSGANSDTAPSVQELAAVLSKLGDPTRLEMLRMLYLNDIVACTEFESTFPISKSTISYHIKELRHAGLIDVSKEGKFYYYTLRREAIRRHIPGLLALLISLASDRSDEER